MVSTHHSLIGRPILRDADDGAGQYRAGKKAWEPKPVPSSLQHFKSREDWALSDPLHASGSAPSDLVTGVAAGGKACPCRGLVLLSPSSSGRCSTVSLQAASRSGHLVTSTVELGHLPSIVRTFQKEHLLVPVQCELCIHAANETRIFERFPVPRAMRPHFSLSGVRGRVNQNVEPSPGVLSTPTFPWCCSMSVWQIYRPRPNPFPEPLSTDTPLT